MTDPQWSRVLGLYETVATLPGDVASAILESSAEEPGIVQEAAILLEAFRVPGRGFTSEENQLAEYAGSAVGRYDVMHVIGRGSTGIVYSGRDRALGRLVALKFLSLEAQHLVREAQAASALNHPNIVTIHEVLIWKGRSVIVMELVDGVALRALCEQLVPLPRVIRIGSQIMQALAAAHANGIVHRNLTPENIVVRPDSFVKLLDFGVARQRPSGLGRELKTPCYQSLEQCRGEPAKSASDIFAAGVILFEMIAGRHPFHADSPLHAAHVTPWSDPLPLTRPHAGVPPWLQSLVQRMLAKEAGSRPSAAEVAEVLANGGLRPRGAPPAARYFTGILVLAAVIAFSLWIARPPVPSHSSLDVQISPLENLRGSESDPSFSPDGAWVAFAFTGETHAPPHIYVQKLADATLIRLTSAAFPDLQPVFSPDGSKLAFLRRAAGRLRVMVMPAAGGVAQQVGEIADIARDYMLMTWDAQGQSLVVSDRVRESGAEIALFQISSKTAARRQVTFPPAGASDWMPAVSPDGQSLGFARVFKTGRGDLWAIPMPTLRLTGVPARRLTTSREAFACWSWSVGGQDLLIAYRRAGLIHLWRQPLDGRPQVRVTGVDGAVTELSVARTGNLMAYVASNEVSNIKVVQNFQ